MVLTIMLMSMRVHVLLYESGKENEGIHSLEINGQTIVLMFEEKEDAERYCGLLEAQDFPKPSIQAIEKKEVELFCETSGYEVKFVNKGFIPSTEEERLLLSPPEKNLDVSILSNESDSCNDNQLKNNNSDSEIDSFRRKLEDLI